MSDGTPKWADLYGIDPDWPVSDTERENHALRRILTDLIAELRDNRHSNTGGWVMVEVMSGEKSTGAVMSQDEALRLYDALSDVLDWSRANDNPDDLHPHCGERRT